MRNCQKYNHLQRIETKIQRHRIRQCFSTCYIDTKSHKKIIRKALLDFHVFSGFRPVFPHLGSVICILRVIQKLLSFYVSFLNIAEWIVTVTQNITVYFILPTFIFSLACLSILVLHHLKPISTTFELHRIILTCTKSPLPVFIGKYTRFDIFISIFFFTSVPIKAKIQA